ncbi:hypothetical protein D9M69_662200 [compost metagenome]
MVAIGAKKGYGGTGSLKVTAYVFDDKQFLEIYEKEKYGSTDKLIMESLKIAFAAEYLPEVEREIYKASDLLPEIVKDCEGDEYQ